MEKRPGTFVRHSIIRQKVVISAGALIIGISERAQEINEFASERGGLLLLLTSPSNTSSKSVAFTSLIM